MEQHRQSVGKKQKQDAIRRLRIVAGQIRGLEQMILDDKYCIDVLHQSLAVKEGLSSFEDGIMKNHLATHVVRQIRSGNVSKAVNEILSIYRISKRK